MTGTQTSNTRYSWVILSGSSENVVLSLRNEVHHMAVHVRMIL